MKSYIVWELTRLIALDQYPLKSAIPLNNETFYYRSFLNQTTGSLESIDSNKMGIADG